MRLIFDPDKWKSPSSQGNNYQPLPKTCGVYLIVSHTMNWLNGEITWHILYVGCSNNLERRVKYHPMKKVVKDKYGFYQVYFIETDNYITLEKELIDDIQPIFNKVGKHERLG